jgi:hypothetical protein
MNDNPLDELDEQTRQTVQHWRQIPEPPDLDRAFDRLLLRTPALTRAPRLFPAIAAAILGGLILVWVPSAYAAMAESARRHGAFDLSQVDPELRAAWRPLARVHTLFLLAGYLVWILVWGTAQVDLFCRLLSIRRLGRFAAHWGPIGSAVASGLWGVGVILGGFWASAVLGRFWDWHPKETGGLVTFLVGVVWWFLGRRVRENTSVLPALIAVGGLWLIVYTYWWSSLQGADRIRFAIDGSVLLNSLLLAVVWGVERWQRGKG